MPTQANLLASRNSQSAIKSLSSRLASYISWGSPGWNLCTLRNASSCTRLLSNPRYGTPQILRFHNPGPLRSCKAQQFSTTVHRQGAWDEEEKVDVKPPSKKKPVRFVGLNRQPNRGPPTHRDVGSAIRAQYYAKQEEVAAKQRLLHAKRIREAYPSLKMRFEKLTSIDFYYDVLIKAQYSDWDFELEWNDRETERMQATFKSVQSALTSPIEEAVLRAEELTNEIVIEWQALSFSMSTRLATEVSQITGELLQAGNLTRAYAAAIYRLRLRAVHHAVSEAEKTTSFLDHEFCTVAFAETPDMIRQMEELGRELENWQHEVLKMATVLFTQQLNTSGLSILDMKDTIENDFLLPRQSARRRIDEITSSIKETQQNYAQLQAKARTILNDRSHLICQELCRGPNLSPETISKLSKLGLAMQRTRTSLLIAMHRHRAAWRAMVMQRYSVGKIRLWEMSAVVSGYDVSNDAFKEHIFEAYALGPRHGGKLGQSLAKNSRGMAKALRSKYKNLQKNNTARSPQHDIYLRQLDVVWPMDHLEVLGWRLITEAWYLSHTLNGLCGSLWESLPNKGRRLSANAVYEWCVKFQSHRADLKAEMDEFYHINWLRLQSENKLYALGENVYLSGRFEALNPISQDEKRLTEWTEQFAHICSEAWIMSCGLNQPAQFWEGLYEKLEACRIADNALRQDRLLNAHGSEIALKKPILNTPLPRTGSFKTTIRANFAPLKEVNKLHKKRGEGASAPEPRTPMLNVQPEARSKQNQTLSRPPQQLQFNTQSDGKPWWMRSRKSEYDSAEMKEARTIGPEPVALEYENPPIASSRDKVSRHWGMAQKFQKISGLQNDADVHPPEQTNRFTNPTGKAPLDEKKSQPLAGQDLCQNIFTGKTYASPSVEPKGDAPYPREVPLGQEGTLSEKASAEPSSPGSIHGQETRKDAVSKHSTSRSRILMQERGPQSITDRRLRRLERAMFRRRYTTDARSYQPGLRHNSSDCNGSLPQQPLEHGIPELVPAEIHETDSVEQASMDETVSESDIEVDVNDSATPKFWSHSSESSPVGEKLIVHYCRTLQNTEETAKHFLGSKVLGFDMEWKSSASAWDSIQNNVSVIQIANEERIAIFQVASFKPSRSLEDLVSPTLKRIIESPDITKVGVSIKADCTRLRKYLGVDAKATFELSHLFKLVKYSQQSPKLVNKRGVNLSDQMEEHFGLPLEKSEDVRCGDWSRALSYRQVQYAATDPYACVRLYHTMEKKRLAMNPMPPRPAFAELNKPIILPLGQAVKSQEEEVQL